MQKEDCSVTERSMDLLYVAASIKAWSSPHGSVKTESLNSTNGDRNWTSCLV